MVLPGALLFMMSFIFEAFSQLKVKEQVGIF